MAESIPRKIGVELLINWCRSGKTFEEYTGVSASSYNSVFKMKADGSGEDLSALSEDFTNALAAAGRMVDAKGAVVPKTPGAYSAGISQSVKEAVLNPLPVPLQRRGRTIQTNMFQVQHDNLNDASQNPSQRIRTNISSNNARIQEINARTAEINAEIKKIQAETRLYKAQHTKTLAQTDRRFSFLDKINLFFKKLGSVFSSLGSAFRGLKNIGAGRRYRRFSY